MKPSQLAAATGARIDRATEWLPVIESAMREFEIDTKQRQAMFLAQIGYESGGLHYTTELWGPTPTQSRYEGRKDLGNTQAGDGFKYRGRGLIQTTGRYNYEATANALGIDCVNNPELLADTENAARSAALYWQSRNLNRFADVDDCKGCTNVINGGYNGLEQRLAIYAAAKMALPEVVIEAIQESPVKSPTAMNGILAFLKFIVGLLGKKS